jgi:hypothetical protein
MGKRGHIQIGRHRIGHFRVLLTMIVLIIVLRPFVEGFARVGLLTDVFFGLVLLSGVYSFSRKGKTFYVALAIALPALVLEVATHFLPFEPIVIIKRVAITLFLAYILLLILSHIFREKEVTEDLITGAICVYLVLGMLWAFVFYFLELGRPGSFSFVTASDQDVGSFLYYSFITLTTVGYGDIVPLTSPARSLAVLEAVTGQLYLAITIARLVGVHASQSRAKET